MTKFKITKEIVNDIMKEKEEAARLVARYYSLHPECLNCPQNETPADGCCKCARVQGGRIVFGKKKYEVHLTDKQIKELRKSMSRSDRRKFDKEQMRRKEERNRRLDFWDGLLCGWLFFDDQRCFCNTFIYSHTHLQRSITDARVGVLRRFRGFVNTLSMTRLKRDCARLHGATRGDYCISPSHQQFLRAYSLLANLLSYPVNR